MGWDLIYLASSKYDRAEEEAVDQEGGAGGGQGKSGSPAPTTLRLRFACHRKVCAAYALSRRGASKIARSAAPFRDSVFACEFGRLDPPPTKPRLLPAAVDRPEPPPPPKPKLRPAALTLHRPPQTMISYRRFTPTTQGPMSTPCRACEPCVRAGLSR